MGGVPDTGGEGAKVAGEVIKIGGICGDGEGEGCVERGEQRGCWLEVGGDLGSVDSGGGDVGEEGGGGYAIECYATAIDEWPDMGLEFFDG